MTAKRFTLADSEDSQPRKDTGDPGANVVPADELFLRKAFEKDPLLGCELLFREYYGPLCSHAVRFVHSREVAKDIVSDLFCVLWQQKLYEGITSSYRAYLYMAVRNRSLKYLRKELGNMNLEIAGDQELTLPFTQETLNPERLMEYEELRFRIEHAIEALPPQRQKVFMMNRYEGLKYQDIADELLISRKAVEGHISKALAYLRKVIFDKV